MFLKDLFKVNITTTSLLCIPCVDCLWTQFQGILFVPPEGHGHLLYIGAQFLLNTLAMVESQARWAMRYIMGDIAVPSTGEMEKECQLWMERQGIQLSWLEALMFSSSFFNRWYAAAKIGTVHSLTDFHHDYLVCLILIITRTHLFFEACCRTTFRLSVAQSTHWWSSEPSSMRFLSSATPQTWWLTGRRTGGA